MGYFGSKATPGLCQAIISLQPPHAVYIEAHLGGGAIMKRKAPALRNIGIDLDARALESFRCDYPVELVHGCAHELLASFPYLGRELVYCDPPTSTRPAVRTSATVTTTGRPTADSDACRTPVGWEDDAG